MENLNNLQFEKFEKFPIWKIRKIKMDEKFQNCQFLGLNFDFSNQTETFKFVNFLIWTIPKISNCKIPKKNQKNFNLDNSKN